MGVHLGWAYTQGGLIFRVGVHLGWTYTRVGIHLGWAYTQGGLTVSISVVILPGPRASVVTHSYSLGDGES